MKYIAVDVDIHSLACIPASTQTLVLSGLEEAAVLICVKQDFLHVMVLYNNNCC